MSSTQKIIEKIQNADTATAHPSTTGPQMWDLLSTDGVDMGIMPCYGFEEWSAKDLQGYVTSPSHMAFVGENAYLGAIEEMSNGRRTFVPRALPRQQPWDVTTLLREPRTRGPIPIPIREKEEAMPKGATNLALLIGGPVSYNLSLTKKLRDGKGHVKILQSGERQAFAMWFDRDGNSIDVENLMVASDGARKIYAIREGTGVIYAEHLTFDPKGRRTGIRKVASLVRFRVLDGHPKKVDALRIERRVIQALGDNPLSGKLGRDFGDSWRRNLDLAEAAWQLHCRWLPEWVEREHKKFLAEDAKVKADARANGTSFRTKIEGMGLADALMKVRESWHLAVLMQSHPEVKIEEILDLVGGRKRDQIKEFWDTFVSLR